MDTWRIRIRGQGSAGQLERTERNLDARVGGTRARGKALRAKRAWELLQLGPTALRCGRLRHVAACEARSARLTARLGAGEGWLTGCLADGLFG